MNHAPSDLTLFHIAPSRSAIVHWMLEELGEPFHLHVLDIKRGDNKAAGYLALNPMGKVPALRHRGEIITEASAICCYLADEFPKAGLNVPVGQPRRGEYLKWLFFGPSCVEPAVMERAFPRQSPPPASAVGWGSFEQVMDVLAAAVGRSHYLIGDRFTAADVVIGSGLRWGMQAKFIPERPEFTAYTGRLEERPALRRAIAKDTELARA